MHQAPYPYILTSKNSYRFISTGKVNIAKQIEFTPTGVKGVYNLAFGDLLGNGRIDDRSASNNGDMVRVLATVIHVVQEFFKRHRKAIVGFAGSTPSRTLFYHRILKAYYKQFSKTYTISIAVKRGISVKEIKFNPIPDVSYVGFL